MALHGRKPLARLPSARGSSLMPQTRPRTVPGVNTRMAPTLCPRPWLQTHGLHLAQGSRGPFPKGSRGPTLPPAPSGSGRSQSAATPSALASLFPGGFGAPAGLTAPPSPSLVPSGAHAGVGSRNPLLLCTGFSSERGRGSAQPWDGGGDAGTQGASGGTSDTAQRR